MWVADHLPHCYGHKRRWISDASAVLCVVHRTSCMILRPDTIRYSQLRLKTCCRLIGDLAPGFEYRAFWSKWECANSLGHPYFIWNQRNQIQIPAQGIVLVSSVCHNGYCIYYLQILLCSKSYQAKLWTNTTNQLHTYCCPVECTWWTLFLLWQLHSLLCKSIHYLAPLNCTIFECCLSPKTLELSTSKHCMRVAFGIKKKTNCS